MVKKTTPAAAPRRAKAPASAAKASTTPEGDRIAKVLSRAGIASRREAERLIEAGEVRVNGKPVTSPALNVTASDRITVSGKPVAAPEPARLWLYYKPEGLVTSASDEKGRETVFDHLPEDMPRVMSVGRLDLNSEGLLLLTNDGELKRRLELPSTGWLRKYRVRVKGNPTGPDLDPLRKGITIDGERFQPMEVVLDRVQGANAWLTVGLREGKNREIRRAMNAIGLIVNRLIRISYGPFRLNELQPGEVEEIRPRILRDQLGALMPDAPEGAEAAAPSARTRAPKPTSSPTGRNPAAGKPGADKPRADKPREGTPPSSRPASGKFAPRAGGSSATGPKVFTSRRAAESEGAEPPRAARSRSAKPTSGTGFAANKPPRSAAKPPTRPGGPPRKPRQGA